MDDGADLRDSLESGTNMVIQVGEVSKSGQAGEVSARQSTDADYWDRCLLLFVAFFRV